MLLCSASLHYKFSTFIICSLSFFLNGYPSCKFVFSRINVIVSLHRKDYRIGLRFGSNFDDFVLVQQIFNLLDIGICF